VAISMVVRTFSGPVRRTRSSSVSPRSIPSHRRLGLFLGDSELEHRWRCVVSQRSGGAGFAQETFAGFGAPRGDADSYDLQRNLALERRVNGAIVAPIPPCQARKGFRPRGSQSRKLQNAAKSSNLLCFNGRIFEADSSQQQTNRAAKPPPCVFSSAPRRSARRNLRGSRLHLLR